MNDTLGDRMKSYEGIETEVRFDTKTLLYARLDGRGFSKFTKGMNRPYDEDMSELMMKTTEHLVREMNAIVGYTQSDEISLGWKLPSEESSYIFDAKKQKMVSTLAAEATVIFNKHLIENKRLCKFHDRLPTFDARVFNVPSEIELVNQFLWRELDATKNAVSMTAHTIFGHAILQGIDTEGKLKMLKDKNVDFNKLPAYFRHGTYIFRKNVEYTYTQEEIDKLPLNHNARKGQSSYTRSIFERSTKRMHDMSTDERVNFIFNK